MVTKETAKPFDLCSRDGRRKMFLTLDVETAGDVKKGNNAIYDLGFAVHDKQGNIYYKRNFLIQEVFDNPEIMATAYYAKKIPKYIEMLRDGLIEKVSLKQAIKFFVKCVNEYNIDTIAAYNLFFDAGALRYTLRTFLPDVYKPFYYDSPFQFLEVVVFRRPINFLCIYNMAAQLLATQKSYFKTAIQNNGIVNKYDWISKADNIRTNAQVMFRYISNDYQFMEAHTGMEDVLVEIQILVKCFRQHKKYNKTIVRFPWHYPQKAFKEYRKAFAV